MRQLNNLTFENGLYPLGKIAKTHGYSGVLVLVADNHLDDELEELNELFLIVDGLIVPFPVIDFTLLTDTSAHIKLEFVNDQTVSKLVGCQVYTTFEPNKQEMEVGFDLWIGFSIHDSNHGKVGIIKKIEDYKGNIVIQIIDGDKETLISFYPELVIQIDDDAKILHIAAPDGYF